MNSRKLRPRAVVADAYLQVDPLLRDIDSGVKI